MVQGAYSIVFLTNDELVAVRDPHGFRPLCMGKVTNGNGPDSVVFASEPPAFDLMGAEYVRDIVPGDTVVVDKTGIRSLRPF
ncbi:MAG: amidophosphoribosyltransferase, partial [Acidobacteria bacterium]|nr:amidophosphoribosyltransferase [Acidobacteriota bacterium]